MDARLLVVEDPDRVDLEADGLIDGAVEGPLDAHHLGEGGLVR